MSRPAPFLDHCRRRHGDAFTIRLAYEGEWVILADPDDVRDVFSGDPARFQTGAANAVLRPILGAESLLLLDGEEHRDMRGLLLARLGRDAIERHRPLMHAAALRAIEHWPRGRPVRMLSAMRTLTLEVITGAVLGEPEAYRRDALYGALRALLDWVTDPRTAAMLIAFGPRLAGSSSPLRRRLQEVHAAIQDEIELRRETPAAGDREDVLSLMMRGRLEDGRALDDAELRAQVLTLLVAGHETTATALAWAAERLMRHPEVLDRLRASIAEGERAYLHAVCKEVLRLRVVLPLVGRRLEDDAQVGRWRLPAGTRVAPCTHLIHRNPALFEAPLRFRPERFLGEGRETHSWVPFGGGARRCPGAGFAMLEMEAVLSAMAERLEIRARRPAPEGVRRRALTWAPARGAEVLLAER